MKPNTLNKYAMPTFYVKETITLKIDEDENEDYEPLWETIVILPGFWFLTIEDDYNFRLDAADTEKGYNCILLDNVMFCRFVKKCLQ